jgi:hypothetical protein
MKIKNIVSTADQPILCALSPRFRKGAAFSYAMAGEGPGASHSTEPPRLSVCVTFLSSEPIY